MYIQIIKLFYNNWIQLVSDNSISVNFQSVKNVTDLMWDFEFNFCK